jgi:hypothetical protein
MNWTLLFVLLFSFQLNAAMTFVEVDENTVSAIDLTSTTVTTIYGGLAGDSQNCSGEESTCDTCAGTFTAMTDLVPCNPRRIHDDLVLVVKFTTSATDLDGATFGVSFGTEDPTTDEINTDYTSTSINTTETLQIGINWADICSEALGTTSGIRCDGSAVADGTDTKVTLNVGIIKSGESDFASSESLSFTVIVQPMNTADANHEDCFDDSVSTFSDDQGVCGFTVFPGDEKVHLLDLTTPDYESSATTLNTAFNSVPFAALRVYGDEVDSTFCSTTPSGDLSAQFSSFTLSSLLKHRTEIGFNGATDDVDDDSDLENVLEIDSTEVTGLTNDTCYGFFIASEDEAGNIGFFTPATYLTTYGTDTEYAVAATPRLVTGLLTDDDKRCFIATSAFGSEQALEVLYLRVFRDYVLKSNPLGVWLTDQYYYWSPKLINEFSEATTLKFWVRHMLRMFLISLLLAFILIPAGLVFRYQKSNA